MKWMVLRLNAWFGPAKSTAVPYVVCLGFFDGVHLGHLALIKAAKQAAARYGARVLVHTYQTPPAKTIFPTRPYVELTPLEQKAALLLGAGADAVLAEAFGEEMRNLSGETFLLRLMDEVPVCHIVTGFNHRFGRGADTGPEELQAFCRRRHLGLTVVEQVFTSAGEAVSSTNVKKALQDGDLALAERMLGRKVDAGWYESIIKHGQIQKEGMRV